MSGKSTKTLEERFWAKVDKNGPTMPYMDTPCWEWLASRRKDGYGEFSIDRRMRLAHRVSYQMNIGPIPAGMCVLHHCDNRGCSNPAHFFLGTRADNAADRERKGRGIPAVMFGEQNPDAKLTEAQVLEIYALKGRESQLVIAKRYSISNQAISCIHRGETWAWLTGANL